MQTPPGSEGPSRFYQLILQEDLLGGWSIVRQWGHLGARGAFRKELFPDLAQAQARLVAYRDQQLKRGFKVMFIHNTTH